MMKGKDAVECECWSSGLLETRIDGREGRQSALTTMRLLAAKEIYLSGKAGLLIFDNQCVLLHRSSV